MNGGTHQTSEEGTIACGGTCCQCLHRAAADNMCERWLGDRPMVLPALGGCEDINVSCSAPTT